MGESQGWKSRRLGKNKMSNKSYRYLYKDVRDIVLVDYFDNRWLEVYRHVLSTRCQPQATVLLSTKNFQIPSKSALLRNPISSISKESALVVPKRQKRLCLEVACSFNPKSSESELISIFSDEKPDGVLANALRHSKQDAAHEFYHFLEGFFQKVKPERISIPNGRLTLQKTASEVAALCGLRIEFLESWKLSAPEHQARAFIQQFSPHSRSGIQRVALSEDVEIANLDEEAYIRRRSDPHGGNKFGRRWNQVAESDEGKLGRTNLLLTTSTDEYVSLGEDWKSHRWQVQYHAFASIISELDKDLGSSFILRIHPNLKNKSRNSVSRELSRIFLLMERFPKMKVVGPLSRINTYALIRDATRVVVSLSFSGLEASILGKSTWCTMPNTYDLVADVRTLHCQEEINEEHLTPWEVNVDKCKRALLIDWSVSEPILDSGKRSSPKHTILDSLSSTSLRGIHIRIAIGAQRSLDSLIVNRMLRRFEKLAG